LPSIRPRLLAAWATASGYQRPAGGPAGRRALRARAASSAGQSAHRGSAIRSSLARQKTTGAVGAQGGLSPDKVVYEPRPGRPCGLPVMLARFSGRPGAAKARHAPSLSYALLLALLSVYEVALALLRAAAGVARLWRSRPPVKPRGDQVSALRSVGIALSSEEGAFERHGGALTQLVRLLLARGVQTVFLHDLYSDQRDAGGSVRAALRRGGGALGAAHAAAVVSLACEHSAGVLLRACRPGPGAGVRAKELDGQESSVHRAFLRGELGRAAAPPLLQEVDLVLVVGPALTLAGFPFWQAASSEIHHVGDLSARTVDRAKAELDNYFCSLKRCGA